MLRNEELGRVDILFLLPRETLNQWKSCQKPSFFFKTRFLFWGFTSENRFMSLYYLVTMKCQQNLGKKSSYGVKPDAVSGVSFEVKPE